MAKTRSGGEIVLFKPRKQRRYNRLKDAHFTPYEARQFVRLRQNDNALKQMVRERRAMWKRFEKMADRRGWESIRKRNEEWKKTVTRFYKRRGWTVWFGPFKGKPSPWEWYRRRYDDLPDPLKTRDTPRNKRGGGDRELDVNQVQVRRWIADLDKRIGEATGEQKRQFTWQRTNLRRMLK